jgi:hypothetical protein
LVFAVVGTGVIIEDFIAVDLPASIIVNLGTVEIITSPVILDYVILEQVPRTVGVINIIAIKSVSVSSTRLTEITVLHRVTNDIIIGSIL